MDEKLARDCIEKRKAGVNVNIAILRRTYITELDGVNNFIFSLSEGLENLGHKVHVVTWSFKGVEKPENLTDWAWKTFAAKPEIISLKQNACNGNPWTQISWDWLTNGSKLLKKLDIDAVIINGIIPLRFGGKKIAVNHGIYEMRPNKLQKTIVKRLYKNCTRVCVSQKLAKEFRSFFGLDCTVIPLPLRLSQFKSLKLEERENTILHVGTRRIKNVEKSIEILRELKKKGVNAKLIVVGAKNDYVEGLIQHEKHSNLNIETKYNIPHDALIDLYSRAKAMLLPSKYEGLAYVAIEAMASGTPVVVSAQIPAEAVTNGYNGFRTETYNPTDYAEKLALLLNDEKLWNRLSENAVQSVSQYDHIEAAKKYEKLITCA
jgi:glycosyltransferase involved in cell wall biosynthesis